MLIPFVLLMAAGLSLAVLKSPPRAARATVPARLTPATARPDWHASVPMAERFERVTVLPYHPAQRAVRIVEVAGDRRRLIFAEGGAQ